MITTLNAGADEPSDDAQGFDPFASETHSETHLVAALMSASHNMTTSINSRLIDTLQWQLDQAHAELDLIVSRVTLLMSGNSMPMPHRILRALYPSRDDIDAGARQRQGERNQSN